MLYDVDGYTPYVDITENKGPLFFLMMAIPQMIVEGTAGVYVLEVLFALGNCLLLMLMTRWLMGPGRNILCVAVCVQVLLRVCGQHLHCEEFDFFFMLLGFAVMVHAYTGQTRGAQARPFVLGLATAAVALIKVSNPDFAKNFATPSGVLASTFAIGCFVAATVVSRKILDIRV